MKPERLVKPLSEKEQRKQSRKSREKNTKVTNEQLMDAIVDLEDSVEELKKMIVTHLD